MKNLPDIYTHSLENVHFTPSLVDEAKALMSTTNLQLEKLHLVHLTTAEKYKMLPRTYVLIWMRSGSRALELLDDAHNQCQKGR
jgi:hypothetical protein